MAWLAPRSTKPAALPVATLVAFGAILGCAIGAGELLRLAERPSGATSVDASITTWVVAHRTDFLTGLAKLVSTVGSQAVLLPLVAVLAVAVLARRRFGLVYLLIAAWGGATLLYTLTKAVVNRMRPPADIWLTNVGRSSSFPSGHATQSSATFVAVALVGSLWLPRARRPGILAALVLAAAVGWSRVYLGVHWTTDVVAGWLIAAAWVWIVVRLSKSLDPKG